MRNSIGVLLVSGLVLTSCGTVRDSRLNPFNWFGRAEAVETTSAKEINPLIPREKESIFRRGETEYAGTPVSTINGLVIERVSGGAILRVRATAALQGAFEVVLEPENEDELPVDGVLTYRVLAIQPTGFRQGTVQSREINAARFRTDQELAGVRTIRVMAADNALQVRRR
ncbi:hypothetical protein Q4544_00175 [Cognatishimia sp. 1_MG-2023]|uniref:hypothetical protein n=1 Tax=Cognatishimia sp. 1_MG-2023 TaxID=3062642 RepID=UPI0026E1525A|nr:hypothetical protein [Cognatishimia sp. 1_MG-2023]MDO6725337.1 hypothetical protein [Cognatishimia sp. 1_MG-2023]